MHISLTLYPAFTGAFLFGSLESLKPPTPRGKSVMAPNAHRSAGSAMVHTRSTNARRPAKSRRIRLFEKTKEKRSNKSKKNVGYTVSETCPGEHSMLNKRERSRECAGGAEEAAEHPAWGMHSVRGVQAVNADSGTGTANSQVCQLRRLGG